MEKELEKFINPNGFSVLVHSDYSFRGLKSNRDIAYVSHDFPTPSSVMNYLTSTGVSNEKILKAFSLVKLEQTKKDIPIFSLTHMEKLKVKLMEALLLHSKVLVCDHFFQELIFEEKEYFKRFFRNLMNKQGIQILLLEDDMNFVCETVKKFYLNTEDGYKLFDHFYDDEIYEYAQMPYTVEFVKYFESCGHKVDHEITFNETLKAIYRGVK